jgi:putative ABC transport system substrate-binding protein
MRRKSAPPPSDMLARSVVRWEESMHRREFAKLIGGVGVAAAWPTRVVAQQSVKVWRIGFLAHRYETFYDPLFRGLEELG